MSSEGKDGVGVEGAVVDVVGGEDDGGPGPVSYALKGLKNHYPVLHVKKGCGLVKHQDVRPAGQRRGNTSFLELAIADPA